MRFVCEIRAEGSHEKFDFTVKTPEDVQDFLDNLETDGVIEDMEAECNTSIQYEIHQNSIRMEIDDPNKIQEVKDKMHAMLKYGRFV